MVVRVAKPAFNLRDKLSELDKPVGFKGSELMKSDNVQEARDLVSAGRKNMIINGSMAVAQRGTSVSAQSFTTAGYPVCDRWQFRALNTDQANYDISNPTDAPYGVCTKSLKVDVNAAETALDANELFWTAQTIEAQNCSNLGFGSKSASVITISFWVKTNVTGRYALYLYSQDPNRYITKTYNVNVSGTWEKKIINIPGDHAGAVINHDNGIGIKIYWILMAGSDYTSVNSSLGWTGYDQDGIAYNHDVNIASSTSNYWQLTGVQVEKGKNGTDFEYRSHGEELALCQRYFTVFPPRSGGIPGWVMYTGASQASAHVWIPHTMRGTPTPTDAGTGTSTTTGHAYNHNGTSVSTRYANGTSPTLSCGGENGHYGINMHFGAHSSGTHEADVASWNGTSPGIFLSAEL